MDILNISRAAKKMAFKELRDSIFENYYKLIGFVKERSYYLIKRLKRNHLLLLATKLIKKKYLILVMLKNTINNF